MSIEIECQYCGKTVVGERISRKYCSDSCKTLACRKRRVDESINAQFKAIEGETNRRLKRDQIKNEKQLKLIQEQQANEIEASNRKQQEKIDALIEGIEEAIHPKGEKKVRSARKDKTKTHDEEKSSSKPWKIRKSVKVAEEGKEPTGLSAFISGFTKTMDSFNQSK